MIGPGLYGDVIRSGDLVFDIGANIGEYSARFVALGADVVAVEPLPVCAAALRKRAGIIGHVRVVEAACGAAPGCGSLYPCEQASALSSMSDDWLDHAHTLFPDYRWDAPIDVEITTLDALIDRFGVPAFVKIDVEGRELAALQGLSRRVDMLSFEFARERLPAVTRCVRRLEQLGMREFRLSFAEELQWSTGWYASADLFGLLHRLPDTAWGDVYAR